MNAIELSTILTQYPLHYVVTDDNIDWGMGIQAVYLNQYKQIVLSTKDYLDAKDRGLKKIG